MTYEKALERWEKVGASKAEGLPLLAMTCQALSLAHAINPKLAYEGAMKLNLDFEAVCKPYRDETSGGGSSCQTLSTMVCL